MDHAAAAARDCTQRPGIANDASTPHTPGPQAKGRVESQLKAVVRAMYSSPPMHGAAVATAVMADPALRAEWKVGGRARTRAAPGRAWPKPATYAAVAVPPKNKSPRPLPRPHTPPPAGRARVHGGAHQGHARSARRRAGRRAGRRARARQLGPHHQPGAAARGARKGGQTSVRGLPRLQRPALVPRRRPQASLLLPTPPPFRLACSASRASPRRSVSS